MNNSNEYNIWRNTLAKIPIKSKKKTLAKLKEKKHFLLPNQYIKPVLYMLGMASN